jgi:hypothetical protein
MTGRRSIEPNYAPALAAVTGQQRRATYWISTVLTARWATTQCSTPLCSPVCGSGQQAASPAAKTPAALVSRYSLTSTPDRRPARLVPPVNVTVRPFTTADGLSPNERLHRELPAATSTTAKSDRVRAGTECKPKKSANCRVSIGFASRSGGASTGLAPDRLARTGSCSRGNVHLMPYSAPLHRHRQRFRGAPNWEPVYAN